MHPSIILPNKLYYNYLKYNIPLLIWSLSHVYLLFKDIEMQLKPGLNSKKAEIEKDKSYYASTVEDALDATG